jgi:hypothetical protein
VDDARKYWRVYESAVAVIRASRNLPKEAGNA